TIPHAERTGSGGRYQLPGTFDPLLTSHFHPCHLTRASGHSNLNQVRELSDSLLPCFTIFFVRLGNAYCGEVAMIEPASVDNIYEKPGEIGLSAAPWKNPMESFRRTTGKLDNGLNKHWVMDDVARFGTRLRPEPRIKKPNASF
ncbi:hypothetical protein Bbelb_446230, partial [Branchiostoma belcheri]